jgi:hypothetical protein
MVRPVAVRQPSIRWVRYWIFFSLRLTRQCQPVAFAHAATGTARRHVRPHPVISTSKETRS